MTERPSEELKLSEAELAQNANRLMEELKDAFSSCPEFQEMLARTYFSIIPGQLEELKSSPVPFRRGNFIYTVLYRVNEYPNRFSHELHVKKFFTDEGNKGKRDEISLLAGSEGLDKEFTWGGIQFTGFSFLDEIQEVHNHTTMAVQKVQEFLDTLKKPVLSPREIPNF
ncbi:MAG: hypothetical protein V1808_03400 [Candidatus Daviesbacteria bacterium]